MTERELIEKWIWTAEGIRATCQNLAEFDALIATQRARLAAIKGEKMSLTPQYILQGAAYALEQCGLLLRDANVLYRNNSYASAVALAAFAREELGRSSILLDFWRRARAGEAFTTAQLKKACDDHMVKQRAGPVTIRITASSESELGKLLQARMKNDPQSAEWQKAETALQQIVKIWRKRAPSDRHGKRIAALYVEPISETEWNKPVVTSASTAFEFLVDATNEYSGRYHQGYITSADSMLKPLDPQLYDALQQWSDRPVLQSPEWPEYQA